MDLQFWTGEERQQSLNVKIGDRIYADSSNSARDSWEF